MSEPAPLLELRDVTAGYAEDIDVFTAAADPFAVEAVVHPNELRKELMQRFRAYSLKTPVVYEKRNPIHPV